MMTRAAIHKSNDKTKHTLSHHRPYSWLVMTRAATHPKHIEAKIHSSHRDTLVRDSWRLVPPYTKVITRQGNDLLHQRPHSWLERPYNRVALIRDLWRPVQPYTVTRQCENLLHHRPYSWLERNHCPWRPCVHACVCVCVRVCTFVSVKVRVCV